MNSLQFIVGTFILSTATIPAFGDDLCTDDSTIEQAIDGDIRHGRTVATDGSILVVGDYSADNYRGAMMIRQWSGGSWTEQQVVYGVDDYDEFGTSVAVANNIVLATASESVDGDVDIIELVDGAWTRTGSLVMPEGWQCAHYGLAMTATWAAVPLVNSDSGFAAVGMWRQSDGAWAIEQTIELGQQSSVDTDMHDDQMVIGWSGADDDTDDEGLVEVYEVDEFDTWNPIADFPGGEANGFSGQMVSIYDDRVAFASGGSYLTNGEWPAKIEVWDFTLVDGWVENWASVFGEFDQLNDLDLGDGVLAAAIWGIDGWSTVTVHPETGMELSFHDQGGEGYGPRYTVDVGVGMVLYDVTLDDESREVRWRPAHDCDQNGVSDACDNLLGSADLDVNGQLDRCECLGNINPHIDANVDVDDISAVLFHWGSETGHADCDGDGTCGVLDLLIILENWGECEE
ncbi:MAG: hypothetical protein MK077_10115 [Phycisphaerales bacterium]|nr:hypothetical protein [Phycisphaerales bacterium]